jgi:hypothetical protein
VNALKPLLDRHWRLYLVWLGLIAIVGVLACLAPLAETLGYEYALVIALASAAGAGHLAACYPQRVRRQLAPFPGARWPVLLLYARALIHSLSLLNGARVPPCNVSEGLLFFALLPVPSVALATALGLTAGLATPGTKSASAVWFALFGASLGAALAEFHGTPAVYSFGPFHGYFPGVLYDELVQVDARLLTYRAASLVQTCTLLGLCSWAVDTASLKLSARRLRLRSRSLAVFALFLGGAAAFYLAGPFLGHRTSRADLTRILPVQATADGLELFFPAGTDRRIRDELAFDASFALHQVGRYLDAPAGGPIAVFFFADYEQKRKAMGASRTNVAKPWRGEVYVVLGPVPHEVLRHELVHAVAARFGRGPFAVAGNGLMIDPGLVEGLAVAAQGPRGDLTAHQWTAAMRREELLPPLERLFGLGFLNLAQSTAYTAAGSFCRFIHHEHGAEALRRVYAGDSWNDATGRDLQTLERAWHAMLDAVPLTAADLAAARYRFDRPSVIHSVCVHEVARLRAQSSRAARRGNWDEALSLLEDAHRRSGGSPDTRIGLFQMLIDAGRTDEARRAGAELLADPGLGLVRAAAIREILADQEAAASPTGSARIYGELATDAADEDRRRVLEVKHRLAAAGHLRRAGDVLEILDRRPGSDAVSEPRAMLVIADAARSAPDDPILAYLLARQHFRHRDHERVLTLLDHAEGLGLADTTPSIRLEARMMHGRTLLALGRNDDCQALFAELAGDTSLRDGARERARDWAERCEFAASQR